MGRLKYYICLLAIFSSIIPTKLFAQDSLNVTRLSTLYHYWDSSNDIAYYNNYIYLCCSTQGLVIFDITNHAQPEYTGYIGNLRANAVQVSGHYAYVLDGFHNLVILDLTNPARPVQLGNLSFTAEAHSITIEGDNIFLSCGMGGMIIADISGPGTPTIVSTYTNPVDNIAISGNYGYAVCVDTLSVINLADQSNPVRVFSIQGTSPVWWYRGIKVSGNFAYVSAHYQGLHIFNLTQPEHPVEVGTLSNSAMMHDCVVSGTTAYIAGDSQGTLVVDVSDPHQPSLVSTLPINGQAWNLKYTDSLLFVAGASGSFQIINIAIPNTPVTRFEYGQNTIYDIAVSNNIAYLATRSGGLKIVDCSNPRTPVQIGQLHTANHTAYGVAVSDSILALNCGGSGVDIINVANPEQLAVIATIPTAFNEIARQGHYFYGSSSTGLRIYDLSIPASPQLLSTYPGTVYGLKVVGNYAYFGSSDSVMSVVDVSNPEAPTLAGRVIIHDEYLQSIEILGNFAFVSFYTNGPPLLHAVDISNPATPHEIGSSALSGHVMGMAASSHFIWYSFNELVKVLDATRPDSLIDAGHYGTGGNCYNMVAVGEMVYLADSYNLGIYRYIDNTSIQELSHTQLIKGFSLEPNYPNPFNATTRISFSLPYASNTDLDIFDVNGRILQHLFIRRQNAGQGSVIWNGDKYSSGTYFYRLRAGKETMTRKMMLVK